MSKPITGVIAQSSDINFMSYLRKLTKKKSPQTHVDSYKKSIKEKKKKLLEKNDGDEMWSMKCIIFCNR